MNRAFDLNILIYKNNEIELHRPKQVQAKVFSAIKFKTILNNELLKLHKFSNWPNNATENNEGEKLY